MRRLVILSLLLPSCVADEVCDDSDRTVEGDVATPDPATAVTADLKITGTIEPTDVAVAQVLAKNAADELVAVGAAKAGFENFEEWEVTVPAAAFVANQGESEATISVFAIEVCSAQKEYLLGGLTAPAFPPSNTAVSGLGIDVTFADETSQCYVPADGRGQATLTVSATEESIGGLVTLQISAGQVTAGELDEMNRLRLEEGASGASQSIAFFAKDTANTIATIRASAPAAEEQVANVLIAGKPEITAGSAAIPAGGRTTLSVTSRGLLGTCEATVTTSDATATVREPGAASMQASDRSITGGPVEVGTKDCSDGELALDEIDSALIDVVFLSTASAATQVSVICRDTYQQQSDRVTVMLMPAP